MTDREVIDGEAVEVFDPPVAVGSGLAVRQDELTVSDLLAQSAKIEQVVREAMRPDVHYGVIPGVNKPSLLKPGAEKLLVLFRLAPHYERETTFGPGDHFTAIVTCALHHAPTGIIVATGEGMCSTRESRYAYRQGGRLCPECGQPAIIKGKSEYGGGWLCFGKKGGCGAKFADGTDQATRFDVAETGRVENPDLPDVWNTVLKMGDKRALIAAILNGTAASDVFTQDVEDRVSNQPSAPETAPEPQRAFDPEQDLLPGAISGKDAPTRIAAALHEIEPSVDWQQLIGEVVKARFGKDGWRELSGSDATDFWRRLSNTTHWLAEVAPPAGEFPPVSTDKIVAAFAYGFSGEVVEVPYSEPAPLTPEQGAKAKAEIADVPFGEEG